VTRDGPVGPHASPWPEASAVRWGRKRTRGNNLRAVLGRLFLGQSASRRVVASPLLRLQSQPGPCARHVNEDVSHSLVRRAFGQPLTIVCSISEHRGGKHGLNHRQPVNRHIGS